LVLANILTRGNHANTEKYPIRRMVFWVKVLETPFGPEKANPVLALSAP
jgi:hypothetical protein